MENKPKVAVINSPITVKSGNIPLSNLIDILLPISSEIYLLSGNIDHSYFDDKEFTLHILKHNNGSNTLFRIINHFYLQVTISYIILSKLRGVNLLLFFIGGEQLVLPMLTAKILRKKILLLLAGNPSEVGAVSRDPLYGMVNLLSRLNLRLFADKILVYSNSIIKQRRLQKYNKKLILAHEHYIDTDYFKLKTPYHKRKNIIGYIGALSRLKGVENLINAIPDLLKIKNDLKFIFIGDGPLLYEIQSFIEDNKLGENVLLKGWVKHDDLPLYLNEFKLLVLPSYTEGLPNVIIEAMACGTPILTTSVGAIPDFIKDNYNGFILKDNSSNCIKKNITKILDYSDINIIIRNAYILVKENFSYNYTVQSWENILKFK